MTEQPNRLNAFFGIDSSSTDHFASSVLRRPIATRGGAFFTDPADRTRFARASLESVHGRPQERVVLRDGGLGSPTEPTCRII